MNLTSGLLWQDNSGKPIEQVIEEASQAYRAKFGSKPNTCRVYRELADEPFRVNGVLVVPDYQLAGHLLIGKVGKGTANVS